MRFGKTLRKKPYESLSLKERAIQQALSNLLKHARELWKLVFGRQRSDQERREQPVTYEAPRLTKLTPEQAKLKLLGHLSLGDQGAKDLLDLLFPEPGSHGAEAVKVYPDSQNPNTPGTSLGLAG